MSEKSYNIELWPDESILLFEATKEFTVTNDWPQADPETRKFLDQAKEPLYHLIDLTGVNLTLDDIVLGVNNLSRGTSALWKHPNIQKLIFVTTNATIRMAVKGLYSPMFGNVRAEIFETREEALDYIRAKTAET